MRALITGIKGFAGQYLQDELENNSIEVFGVSRERSSQKNIHTGDITSAENITKIIKKTKPDVLFHLAGFTSVKESWENPDLAMNINKGGTENIYKAISAINPGINVILISSAEVYGRPKKIPITESNEICPENPYSKSKLAQEEVAKNYPHIKTIICRSFHHTGPRQQPIFVVPSFAKQIAAVEAELQNEILVGNLEAQRDFTDVRDVVRAYRMLSQSNWWGQIYNICSGRALLIRQILDTMLQYSAKSIPIVRDQSKIRPSDIPLLVGDCAKIKNDIGWMPEIPLEQTLLDTLNYWRKKTQKE